MHVHAIFDSVDPYFDHPNISNSSELISLASILGRASLNTDSGKYIPYSTPRKQCN